MHFIGILEPCQALLHGLVFCQTLLHGLVLEQVPFEKVYGSASRAQRALEALPDTFAWSSFRAGPSNLQFLLLINLQGVTGSHRGD